MGIAVLATRKSNNKVFEFINKIYLTVFRSVPTIVLLFLIYFGIPQLASKLGYTIGTKNKLSFVVITFTLIIAATSSEIMRSAYESVNKGQFEAAVSVGLTPLQAFRRIIIPQALVVALPNIGNSIVFLIKDGALAYTIGLNDIYGGGLYISSLDYQSYLLEIYIAMTVFYWPVCEIIVHAVNTISKRISTEFKGAKIKEKVELEVVGIREVAE